MAARAASPDRPPSPGGERHEPRRRAAPRRATACGQRAADQARPRRAARGGAGARRDASRRARARAMVAARDGRRDAAGAGHGGSHPHLLAQRRHAHLADPGHLLELLDRAEAAVRLAVVEICCAVAGPTPSSSSSCSSVAVLRFSGTAGACRRRRPRRRSRQTPPRSGARSGTSTWRPSSSSAARLSALRSRAAAARRPRASTASSTRDPARSRYTPGRRTAPATWTVSAAARVARPPCTRIAGAALGGAAAAPSPRPRYHAASTRKASSDEPVEGELARGEIGHAAKLGGLASHVGDAVCRILRRNCDNFCATAAGIGQSARTSPHATVARARISARRS